MKPSIKLVVAAAIGLAAVAAGAGYAHAMMQADTSAELRATGQVGEQADGYMGVVVAAAPGDLRARVTAVNIKRRAAYAELAASRGAQIEEVAATMACEIFATRVLPGQYYRLHDGVWRRRNGTEPVPRPAYCV